MNPTAQYDLIVYGATGYTGRLVAEHLARQYGVGGEVNWAMAGRNAEKLAQVRDEIGAPKETPLVVADADDPAGLDPMVRSAKAVITTVGPYQLYGDRVIAACAEAGTDYLDLTGEVNWMARTIPAYHEVAQRTGARLVHSAGFDSIPFELGVYFCQETARQRLGAYVPRVKGRIRAIKGGLSGGTAASGAAVMAAVKADPSVVGVLMNPFCLTPGFTGPPQPPGNAQEFDADVGAEVGPFMMAAINTKNVHRSNFLMGHAWGREFQYDEMAIVTPGAPTDFSQVGEGGPKPGEGPTKEERETGFYEILFVGLAADGRQVRVSVRGDKDPGYGSTSKMLAEAGVCLVKEGAETPGGVWTPGAAMRDRLIQRLQRHAGITFTVEG